jgi:hypothetical protein
VKETEGKIAVNINCDLEKHWTDKRNRHEKISKRGASLHKDPSGELA